MLSTYEGCRGPTEKITVNQARAFFMPILWPDRQEAFNEKRSKKLILNLINNLLNKQNNEI